MRILYIGNFDPRETGGTLRAFEIVKRVRKHGVDPLVLNIKSVHRDVLTRIGALYSIKVISTISRGIDEVKAQAPDLVVSTSESPETVIPAYNIAKKLGVPWTTIMQLPIKLKYTPASTEPILIDPLWLPQMLMVLNLLRRTTVLSVSLSCIVESSVKIPRFYIIKPGVGIDYERYVAGRNVDKVYDALFMARLTPEKGVFDVVKVWSRVVKNIPDAKLAVAGRFKNDKIRRRFFRLVTEYGLEKNITYLGYLTEDEKIEVLKKSRLFLYPSKLDALPIVILEALASGLPVVAYDIPAIRYNYPLKCVIRVPVGRTEIMAAKVVEIVKDYDYWNNLASKENSEYVKNHTWDNVVRAEVLAYSKIMKEVKSS